MSNKEIQDSEERLINDDYRSIQHEGGIDIPTVGNHSLDNITIPLAEYKMLIQVWEKFIIKADEGKL